MTGQVASQREPVAWRWRFDADGGPWSYGDGKPVGRWIGGDPVESGPLYTHPAPAQPDAGELREAVEALTNVLSWLEVWSDAGSVGYVERNPLEPPAAYLEEVRLQEMGPGDGEKMLGDLMKIGQSADVLLAALTGTQQAKGGWTPTHRHLGRGTEYEVIGEAQVQTVTGLCDYDKVTVYRGEEGDLWVRACDEFNDGRFAALMSETKG